MIGNPYPQHQNVQEWNDFVNEVRNVLARTEQAIVELKSRVLAGEGGYDFPDATEEEAGVMKLYQAIGDNYDGSISQAGVKTILQDYVLSTVLDTKLQDYAKTSALNSYYTKDEMNTKLSELFATDAEIQELLDSFLPEISA